MNDNEKIVIDIKELYATADPSKIRSLIAKHFIPSESEKKQNAEIPTPVKLVDEMLNTIPAEFWKTPKRVFEPCCGKGNFVLGIFDKFYNGLATTIPEEKARIRTIIKDCLYYADITEMNVFITTEILKCHIQAAYGRKLKMENIKFNSYVGDTLELDINDVWGVEKGFDAVIGNPPYNKNMYIKFSLYLLKLCNILLFVIPSNFTMNITGVKFEDTLKTNGLKYVNFLKKIDFENSVDIDTLYFLLDKSYTGDIIINNDIIIDRNEKISNLSNSLEYNIFKKIRTFESIKLYKGSNKTLSHKNPIETDNIKKKKTETHKHKMLSRLNGGRGDEIYYVKDFKLDSPDNFKIVFPRGTASYNSINNLLKLDKDIVFNKLVDNKTILSNGLMYVKLENKEDYELIKAYLMRSKLIRFIFITQNKSSELTKGLFKFIPKIPIENLKDNSIYNYLGFIDEEILYIENTFWKK